MDKDRPHFSKGYTFHFSNGDIGIILNDGLYGTDFIGQYCGQNVIRFYSNTIIKILVGGDRVTDQRYHVWYNIMVGDIKGWITEYRLEQLKYDQEF